MKKLDRYINRDKSVITRKGDLEHLYTLKNFPVFFGCVATPPEEDMVANMNWAIDKETGVVQLTQLIPLEILYKEQHVDGCGRTWQKYYDDFTSYVLRQKVGSVLEIGGGSGQIAERAIESSTNITWTIVEPNPTIKEHDGIKVVAALFDKNFALDYKVDAIVMSQVLEHIYYPRDFLNEISSFLNVGGKVIVAYPQLELWLDRKFTNALNFEHTMLLTDQHLDFMFPEHGFKVLDKTKYEDHSFFYTIEKTMELPANLKRVNKYTEYKKLFLNFVNYHLDMVAELNERIMLSKQPVYLFGAHIFSTYLLAFGLNPDGLQPTILDHSPTKKGKRLYGTSFMVDFPEILRNKGPVSIVLKAGLYNEEIKEDIVRNINSEVSFF